MCLAKPYVEQLRKLNDSISATCVGLTRMQSQLDKELSALYHEIEATELDVNHGYQLALRLQAVLKRRRVVKDEYARVKSIKHSLESAAKDADTRYRTQVKKSNKLRRSLNVTMTFTDVLGEINITEGLSK